MQGAITIDEKLLDSKTQKELWTLMGQIAWGREVSDFVEIASEHFILIERETFEETG